MLQFYAYERKYQSVHVHPVTKKCTLCLKDKLFIMYSDESSTLKKKSEVYNTCEVMGSTNFHFGLEKAMLWDF